MSNDTYEDSGDFNVSITHEIKPVLKHKNFDITGFDHNNEVIIGNLYTDKPELMDADPSNKTSPACIYIGKMSMPVRRYLEEEGFFDEYPERKEWIFIFTLILDKIRGKSQT